MSPGGRMKALIAQQREQRLHAIDVLLPNGEQRSLEPGDKIYAADATTLRRLGLAIDVATLLPDALLVDIAASPAAFWIIQAVATDGPIDEDRKRVVALAHVDAEAAQNRAGGGRRAGARADREAVGPDGRLRARR